MKTITAKLIPLDVPTKSGHIYPEKSMRKAIKEYKKLIKEKKSVGIFYNGIGDLDMTLDLCKVSHLVENLKIKNGMLIAEIGILDTPMGKELQKELERQKELSHDTVVFSPTGYVTYKKDKNTIKDYTFRSIDAIHKE
jgi:hypothetical protein